MSSNARAPVLPALARRPPRADIAERVARPRLRFLAFAALALYGVQRWGTLIQPAPGARLLGLLGLTLVLALVGPRLAARHWLLGLSCTVVAFIAMFPICGVPLAWIRHARIEVIANGIGEGLSSLPAVLLPYNGINHWTQVVILLGAGVLLLDAGLSLAFAGSMHSDLRRAGVALPLIALAVVPCTLLRPHFPYLQGVLLFALIALFMWGERISRADMSAVLGLCVLAAAAAMILAPALDEHKPWINYEALANGLAPAKVETFDWAQTYGPISWPQKGHEVLDVSASTPEYWKTEDLDVFNTVGWEAAAVPQVSSSPSSVRGGLLALGVKSNALKKWTEQVTVTIRAMKTNQVIAAGTASKPTDISGNVVPGAGAGTWMTANQLSPGDSYRVSVYAPNPSPPQLEAAGTKYPRALDSDLTLEIPYAAGTARVPFPVFHTRDPGGSSQRDLIMAESPYEQVYKLAQRLAERAANPYAFATAVRNYLQGTDFTYNQNPPQSDYPLASFLDDAKEGYCQQFAGAMALLLRMGGVPARVATGFTNGVYNSTTHEYVVSDLDAHAWDEVWFPGYGWYRMDPTPAADPALGGRTSITPAGSVGTHTTGASLASKLAHDGSATPTRVIKHSHGISALLVIGLVVAALALAGLLLAIWRAGRERAGEELVVELERAMARTGRPIAPGTTLAELERRVRGRPDAQSYIRTLCLARFGAEGELPTLRQRRALRAELTAGLGLPGAIRAIRALPPRWRSPRRRSGARAGA